MPKDIYPDDFRCPECNKVPEYTSVIGVRKYSMRKLDLPYFLCGDCRICSYSKLLLRQCISRWRKDSAGAKAIPYNQIYQESKGILEGTLRYYVKTAEYRLGRFRKK